MRALAAVVLVLVMAAPAAGQGTADLADRALRGDDAALTALRAGSAGPALAGAQGEDLRARLTTLRAVGSGAPAPRGADRIARDVLDDRRFGSGPVAVPGRSILARIGNAVLRALRTVRDAADAVLPGGRSVVWPVLALLVAGLAVLAARRTIERRGGALVAARRATGRVHAAADPEALERAAGEREAAGDLDAALRLRFRAGLLRLGEERPDVRPGRPNGELARALRSDAFDRLARDLDAVAYGGGHASPEQVAAAREHWPRVLDGTRR